MVDIDDVYEYWSEIDESRIKILARGEFDKFGAIVFGELNMGDGGIQENGDLHRRKREWEGEFDKLMKSRQKSTRVGLKYSQGRV